MARAVQTEAPASSSDQEEQPVTQGEDTARAVAQGYHTGQTRPEESWWANLCWHSPLLHENLAAYWGLLV
jgi:hypothetical protein